MTTGLQNAVNMQNAVKWSMQTGFNARAEKDKGLVTQSETVIAKIDTLVQTWREAQAKIKAAISTYQNYAKPQLKNLEKEINDFKMTLQPLVNKAYKRELEVDNLVNQIQKRIPMDPLGSSQKLTVNASYFKPILGDLALMNIPTEGIATKDYEQFHQDTLKLTESKKALVQANTRIEKVEYEVVSNLHHLKSVKDNHGKVHYRPVFLFWKVMGAIVWKFSEERAFYQYPRMVPESLLGHQPEMKPKKKAVDEALALKIPLFKKGHEERSAHRKTSKVIRDAIAKTKPKIIDVKNRLLTLMTPTDETAGVVVRGDENDDTHQKLEKEYTEFYTGFLTSITQYNLVKKKLPKKLKVEPPYNAGTIIVTLGHLTKDEIHSCYHTYNLNRAQLEANLNSIEGTSKELSPIFKEIRNNLTILKNDIDKRSDGKESI